MANSKELVNQLKGNKPSAVAPGPMGLKALMSQDAIQKKFKEVLKDKAPGFTSSVLSLVNNDKALAEAEPMSILTGAMVAATLDLPLDKNLGYAYIIPFKEKQPNGAYIQKGQFILGYKGYIQLAQRSGQYKALNVINVYEGELVSWDRLEEKIVLNYEGRTSDKVIGYCAHFELVNGYKKTVYWSREQVEAHEAKHRKGKYQGAVWRSDFDSMAQKTVLKNMLSKWGILSIEMQRANMADDRSVEFDETGNMVDVTPDEPFELTSEDPFTAEVVAEIEAQAALAQEESQA